MLYCVMRATTTRLGSCPTTASAAGLRVERLSAISRSTDHGSHDDEGRHISVPQQGEDQRHCRRIGRSSRGSSRPRPGSASRPGCRRPAPVRGARAGPFDSPHCRPPPPPAAPKTVSMMGMTMAVPITPATATVARNRVEDADDQERGQDEREHERQETHTAEGEDRRHRDDHHPADLRNEPPPGRDDERRRTWPPHRARPIECPKAPSARRTPPRSCSGLQVS